MNTYGLSGLGERELAAMMEKGWSEEGARFLLERAAEEDEGRWMVARILGTVASKARRKSDKPIVRTVKAPIPDQIRWEVWERDDFRCRHCGTRRFLSIDHIIPESKGGTLELDNLQTLCRPCNSRKGNR